VADMSFPNGRAERQADHSLSPAMTLAEAEALTGRPVAALRALMRRDLQKPPEEQRLRARKNNNGEWLIELPAELMQPAPKPAGRHAGHETASSAAMPDRLAALEGIIASRLAGLEASLAEVKIIAATAVAERDAAKAAGTLEASLLRQQLERELGRVTELERQLAQARQPWWLRMLRGS
jgi:hypothetical protein